MKKNILLLLTTLLLSANAGAFDWKCCFDRTNYYAKLLGGANFVQTTSNGSISANYKTGYIVAGSLGYNWCYGLSFETEFAFRRNPISKINFVGRGSATNGHFQTTSFMGNVLWDVPTPWRWCTCYNIQSFIGAGIGYDLQHMHASNSSIIFVQRWNHFSWQLMGGFSYPVYCNTEMTFEYKFHQGGCNFYNHTIGIGLVYTFGNRR